MHASSLAGAGAPLADNCALGDGHPDDNSHNLGNSNQNHTCFNHDFYEKTDTDSYNYTNPASNFDTSADHPGG